MELRYLMLKVIKGNPCYKNHSSQHNSKGLHTILVPFGYVHIDIKRQLLSFINISVHWHEKIEKLSVLHQRVCYVKEYLLRPWNCYFSYPATCRNVWRKHSNWVNYVSSDPKCARNMILPKNFQHFSSLEMDFFS